MPAAPDDQYRLPRTVEPVVYHLTLEPDLHAATFSGAAEIWLDVHEPTDVIVCNAAELAITDAQVGGRPVAVELDAEAERVTFRLTDGLAQGPATLTCRFTGALNDRLRGFYRSTFVDADGETRVIATTQMEATDARRAFPCWDEPDRKAVFDVTLVVDEELAAYSNSAVDSWETVGDGRKAVHFAPTMKMSTYLVAFVVGPLEATEPRVVDGVPVRVVHVPGKAALAGYALDVAEHSLRFFTEYFDIPYPAGKLDLVAIPDFAFGAMENLGCVTFRETALLVDPASAARVELERIADVVAHEIAHMWFGDLVTMGWWEGIWLNEAFATFMEVLCVDAFRPAWKRWLSFGVEREAALATDGLHSTRAIEYPVGSPDEADGMFDVLTYQKGGSVLRMLEQYLGPPVFRDGVRLYLRRHSYANTVTSDLWDALEEAAGDVPVRATMDTLILQGGHPLVSVSGLGSEPASGGLGSGELHQSPFAYRPQAAGEVSAIGSRWIVPVQLRGLDGGSGRVLLTEASAPVPPGAVVGPAVVNAGGWGVYRSGYSPDQLAALGSRLADLEPLERALLFTDTWALVVAGRAELGDLLSLGARLGDDPEPTTFAVLVRALDLCHRVAAPDDRPAVAAATRALLGPRFAALTFSPQPGEDERTPNLRASLVRALGVLGDDADVRRGAIERFDGPAGSIDPDIASAVLDVVAQQLRPGDYDTVLARYRDAATPQEEQRYLFALGAFPDVGLTERTVELCFDEVRTQNAPYLLRDLLANRVTGPTAWALLEERWEEALAKFPANSHSRMLDGVSALCADPSVAARVTAFLEAHPLAVGSRQVSQALERLAINVAFGQRARPTLAAAMERVTGAGSGAGSEGGGGAGSGAG